MPARPPAPTRPSDYLPLPVLTRPAETRQHIQFYLLPSLWSHGGPTAPLPHPCLLWLTRPAETRQPPYLPSPPPPPPSYSRTPLARREYGPPWRSSAPRLAQQSLPGCAWLRARSLPRHASSLELASFSHGAHLALPLAPPRSRALHYIIGSARCWRTATLSSARTGTGHTLSASSCTPASRLWSLLLPGGRRPSPPSRLTRSVSLGPRRPDLSLRPCAPFSTPYASAHPGLTPSIYSPLFRTDKYPRTAAFSPYRPSLGPTAGPTGPSPCPSRTLRTPSSSIFLRPASSPSLRPTPSFPASLPRLRRA